jgi:ribosomal protein S27AE
MATTAVPKGKVQVSMNDLEVRYACGCGLGILYFHKDRTTATCGGCGTTFGMRVMVGRVPHKKD